MKTIGMIGGISWQSSAEYYRLINQGTAERLGGLNNARSVMTTVNFADVNQLQKSGDMEGQARMMEAAVRQLKAAGADFCLLCCNTLHKVAARMEAAADLPFLHIAAPAGEAARSAGLKVVGLMSTRYTMEDTFYQEALSHYGLMTLVPDAPDRELIQELIFSELAQGILRDETRARLRGVMARLVERGAEGILLACTELGLILSAKDAPVPVLDTMRLHAAAAVELALS